METTATAPKTKENIFNLPNLLSAYRLAAFPVILYLAIGGNERAFVVLICISLASDLLDGLIARTFHLETRFGAQLDSAADLGTYAVAFYGLFRFRWQAVRPHVWLVWVFVGALVFSYAVGFARFRKVPGLHLLSGVIKAYLQGIFFFALFMWGFQPWLFYLAGLWGILAYAEKTTVLFLLEEIAPGTRGLYWLLQKRRAANGG